MAKFEKISGLVLLSAFTLGVNSGSIASAEISAGAVSKGINVSKVSDSKAENSKSGGDNLGSGTVAAQKKTENKPVAKSAAGSIDKENKVTGNVPVDNSEIKTKSNNVKQGDIGFAQGVGIASGTAGTIGIATSAIKKLFEKSGDSSKGGSKEIETNDNEDNGRNSSKTKDNQTDGSSSGSQTASRVVMYVAIVILLILILAVVCIATSGKFCIQGVCSCCCC